MNFVNGFSGFGLKFLEKLIEHIGRLVHSTTAPNKVVVGAGKDLFKG